MKSLVYLVDDVPYQTNSPLIHKAGHRYHVEYGDHLGVLTTTQSTEGDVSRCYLQQMATVLQLHSQHGQTGGASAEVVGELLQLGVDEADVVHISESQVLPAVSGD